MTAAWKAAMLRFVLLIATALAIGWWYDRYILSLLIFGLGLAAWHVVSLYRTEKWVRLGKKSAAPPDIPGIWNELIAHIGYLRRSREKRRKHVRRLLKEFRALTSAMPDGAVVLDPQFDIVWFNKAAAGLIGLKKRNDVGQRIDNFVRQPGFRSLLDDDVGGKPLRLNSPLHPDDTLQYQLVPYGDGMRLLLVSDVSQQVRLERIRQDFVANASHELRSPLTVITGYLDSLADDHAMDDAWSEPIQEMQRQAARTSTIIQDLLELSRLESEPPSASTAEVDVPGLLALISKEAMAMEQRPQNFELAIESNSWLRGSESELQSAFINLVSNAIKFTSQDGMVEVRWTDKKNGALLEVRDTGIGIPEPDLPRVTERFYRVDPGRARSQGGTGLGLAIVKHVMQRHQAALHIESKLGEGSLFACYFPASRVVRDHA